MERFSNNERIRLEAIVEQISVGLNAELAKEIDHHVDPPG